MVLLGVPKGRFLARSLRLLDRLGGAADDGRLRVGLPVFGATALVLKTRDIANLLAAGDLDLGIVPEEWLVEAAAPCHRLAKLCWCHSRICLIGTPGMSPVHDDGAPLRVATEYPVIAERYLRRRLGTRPYTVQHVHGATEAYLPDLADAVIDCVETGSTLVRNRLEVADEILRSDVYLAAAPSRGTEGHSDAVQRLAQAVRDAEESAAEPCEWVPAVTGAPVPPLPVAGGR